MISLLCALISCSKEMDDEDGGVTSDQGSSTNNSSTEDTIVVPEYKDYGRGTQNFKDVVYKRPSISSVTDSISAVASAIVENTTSVDQQITAVNSLKKDISNVKTMHSLVTIHSYSDSSVQYWKDEFTYLSSNYPLFSQAIESLIVACARSEHRTSFESECFGYQILDYADGGKYTDRLVSLLSEEAMLEAEYIGLSTSNVEIKYISVDGFTAEGTADEVLEAIYENYGSDDTKYQNEYIVVKQLYHQKLKKMQSNIYIKLIKIRRLIADELGYESYAQLAYEELGYDYTASDMIKLLTDISQYISPVNANLENTVFDSYFSKIPITLSNTKLINDLYSVYSTMNPALADIYSYMLQHSLYSISGETANRSDTSFTTYLEENNSPFLFVTTSGYIYDYSLLTHEFGHFADGYINYGSNDSVSLSEVSSHGLELLTLLSLEEKLSYKEYEYLNYYTMRSTINDSLLTRSIYAIFEHYVYSIDYDEISEESINNAVNKAFRFISGTDPSSTNNLTIQSVTLSHTVLTPFLSESYVTSGLVALDIFFIEDEGKGDGLAIYMDLLDRDGNTSGLSEQLEQLGLDSPFESGKVKDIANKIYCHIVGKNYFKDQETPPNAA